MTSEFAPNTVGIETENVSCFNCDWTGRINQLDSIENPSDRLEPGDTVPAGECPNCGMLVPAPSSRDNPPPLKPELLEQIRDRAGLYLRNLGSPVNAHPNSAVAVEFRRGMAAATIKVVELIMEEHGIPLREPPNVTAAFQELLKALTTAPPTPSPAPTSDVGQPPAARQPGKLKKPGRAP